MSTEQIFPNVQIRQESRIANVYLAKNGILEKYKNEKVNIMMDSVDLTILEFQNFHYPIVKSKGDKIFYQERMYKPSEAWSLPAMLGYMIVSTFYNIQTLFDIEQLVTISNLYLVLVIMALSFAWGLERVNKEIAVIYIAEYMRHYKTIQPRYMPSQPITQTYVQYNDFTFYHSHVL